AGTPDEPLGFHGPAGNARSGTTPTLDQSPIDRPPPCRYVHRAPAPRAGGTPAWASSTDRDVSALVLSRTTTRCPGDLNMPRKGTCMHKWSIRLALMAVATVTALAGADRASAGGAVNIDSCQTLSTPNTTYRLTADISNASDCLIVAADRITIDLQGNSLISPFATDGIGITDRGQP